MIHAPLSAGNLSLPPLLHSPHFLPLTARTASQLPLTLSDCYLQHEAVYSSPLPRPPLSSHMPPFSPQSPCSNEAALIWLFRQIHFATLIAQGHGQNSKIHIRWHWKLSPASANDAVDVANNNNILNCGRRRRHRRSFIDVCIMWQIQLWERNKTTIWVWFLVFNCSWYILNTYFNILFTYFIFWFLKQTAILFYFTNTNFVFCVHLADFLSLSFSFFPSPSLS